MQTYREKSHFGIEIRLDWILTLVKQSFDLRREKLAGDLGDEGVEEEEEERLRRERGLLFLLVGVTSPEVLQ